ncbi:MAG: hypothetical protein ROO71_09015 [Balneola sp.]
MIHRTLLPKNIYLVGLDQITDGTVATLAALKAAASVYAIPNRPEEGITFTMGGEDVTREEQGSDGVITMIDSVQKRRTASITINESRWSFKVLSLLNGQKIGDIETNHELSIDADADATAVTGLKLRTSIVKEKFAVLIEFPVNKDDAKTLYLYLPKMGIATQDVTKNLNHDQQKPPMQFNAYALETADPDELTPQLDIYNKITDNGLYYFIEGKKDVV